MGRDPPLAGLLQEHLWHANLLDGQANIPIDYVPLCTEARLQGRCVVPFLRKVCGDCNEGHPASSDEMTASGTTDEKYYKASQFWFARAALDVVQGRQQVLLPLPCVLLLHFLPLALMHFLLMVLLPFDEPT